MNATTVIVAAVALLLAGCAGRQGAPEPASPGPRASTSAVGISAGHHFEATGGIDHLDLGELGITVSGFQAFSDDGRTDVFCFVTVRNHGVADIDFDPEELVLSVPYSPLRFVQAPPAADEPAGFETLTKVVLTGGQSVRGRLWFNAGREVSHDRFDVRFKDRLLRFQTSESKPGPGPIAINPGSKYEPRALYQPAPPYPLEARKTRLTGAVRVEIVVDPEGKVLNATLLSGNPIFSEPALETVRTWRFEPVAAKGVALSWKTIVKLKFELPEIPDAPLPAAPLPDAPQTDATSPIDVATTGIRPRATHQPHPPYPTEARSIDQTGVVVAEIVVGADGQVTKATLLSGDALFAESALATLRTWRYEPVVVNGTPIHWKSKITLRFKLRDPLPKAKPADSGAPDVTPTPMPTLQQ